MTDPFKGRIWEAETLLRVGRLEGQEVVIDDSSVSRLHAVIRCTERGWRLRDLGSTNGTRLNGVRIGNGNWPLRPRDILQFVGGIAVVVESVIGQDSLVSSTTPARLRPTERAGELLKQMSASRKLRLFAIACCRCEWQSLPDEVSRLVERSLDGQVREEEIPAHLLLPTHLENSVVVQMAAFRQLDVAERYADGLATEEELQLARRTIGRHFRRLDMADVAYAPDPSGFILHRGIGTYKEFYERPPEEGPIALCSDATMPWIRWSDEYLPILAEFIVPMPSVRIDPLWLAWNDGTVVKLTQSIYECPRFDDLPILADALEEAGCDNADILAHLRGPGPHVRGCWVVDLLLNKE
jgi:hypothetical protein